MSGTPWRTWPIRGPAGRRALTYDEVQALFDAADARAGQIRGRGRKGALAALRDAAIMKVAYAYGLRRRETALLDVADFRRNPRVPAYGTFGSVQVRFGKASRGSPPRRRTVLTVPEFDWVTGVLAHWVTELRPRLSPGNHPALWVTERRGRISVTFTSMTCSPGSVLRPAWPRNATSTRCGTPMSPTCSSSGTRR